jgi:hypothetical protein
MDIDGLLSESETLADSIAVFPFFLFFPFQCENIPLLFELWEDMVRSRELPRALWCRLALSLLYKALQFPGGRNHSIYGSPISSYYTPHL